jgi:hypothetical protein
MKAEYEKLIRALRIEFSVEIKEADANTDKWYELYVDKGAEIGTHTVHSASTFYEVIVHFEEYAEQYGISNTHIDIMRQPDDAEVDISLTHSAKLLNVPKLVNVYFRLDSGYVWGGDHPGMSKEKEDAFFAEARRLFSEAGYEIKSIKYTKCPGIVKEFTDLYCHPMDLSGYCEESRIPEIEAILAKGTTFKHRCTDTYKQVYPYNREQEIEYYRQTFHDYIHSSLLSLFTTKRRNLYKPQREVIERLANQIRIDTIKHTLGVSCGDSCETYIYELYKEMVAKGLLIEGEKPIGAGKIKLCRSANAKEIKYLNIKKHEAN